MTDKHTYGMVKSLAVCKPHVRGHVHAGYALWAARVNAAGGIKVATALGITTFIVQVQVSAVQAHEDAHVGMHRPHRTMEGMQKIEMACR